MRAPSEESLARGGIVVCQVDGPLEQTDGMVIFEGGYGGRVKVTNSSLRFQVPPDTTEARITLDGYGATTAKLFPGTEESPGHCGEVLKFEGGPSVVTGMVTHADGRPAGKVWVQGCGRRVLTDVDGSYYLESRASGACQVQAFRRDGVFTIWSEAQDVQPAPGRDTVADLSLPPWQTAGLGAEVRDVEGGIIVMRTLEGGAAWEAGLRGGDLITEIDGIPTTELSLRGFVEQALGPEGTVVEIVVDDEGEERVLELDRRTIETDPG